MRGLMNTEQSKTTLISSIVLEHTFMSHHARNSEVSGRSLPHITRYKVNWLIDVTRTRRVSEGTAQGL